MFTGIRGRLFLYYLLVIAVIVLVIGLFFIWFLNYFYRQALQESLDSQARLVSSMVIEMYDQGSDQQEIQAKCDYLGRELELRITLIDAYGNVLVDTEDDPLLMDNHSDRPEIIAALQSNLGVAERYSNTLEVEMYYLAVPLSLEAPRSADDRVAAVLRLALPLSMINEAIADLKIFILGALLVSALVALGAAAVISHRLTDPIKKISHASRAIAGDNFSPSLEVSGKDELAMLAGNIKEMGQILKEKMNQLLWEKNKVETVINSMSSGIILTDSDLKIELINPAAEKMFDLHQYSVIGQPLNKVIRDYALYENLKNVCTQGESRMLEINLYYPRAAVVDTYIIALKGTATTTIGTLILFHETTELRSLEKMRSDFVANVSHELRTPLTTIRGYTETILYEDLPQEQLFQFLKIIDRETARLSNLLDDLLDLGQIEIEKGYMQKTSVELNSLLQEAVQRVEKYLPDEELNISLQLPDKPVFVSGNREWLRQAIINMLENSVKHGFKGGLITLKLELDNGRAVVEVKDSGPGIPETDLPYIFERFYRVEKGRSRKSGGTGLGLSLVKHIMEAHEAVYSLENVTGSGTVFRFSLPALNKITFQ